MKYRCIFIILILLLIISGLSSGIITETPNIKLEDKTEITIDTPKINMSTSDASLKLYADKHDIFGQDNGESIELIGMQPSSKPYIGWIGYDAPSSRYRSIGWFGCHYLSNTDLGNRNHSHCSLETLDISGHVNTHFEVSYSSIQKSAKVKFPNSNIFVDNSGIEFYKDFGTKVWLYSKGDMRFSVHGKTKIQIQNNKTTITNNVVLISNGSGISLKSPDGTKTACISLDNNGSLITTQGIC